MSSILIIRLSSMGDVLLTTAFVRQLRARFPDARIDYLVSGKFAESLKHNPHISNLYEYDKEDIDGTWNAVRSSLPGGRYDIVIDLQKNLRSWKFRRLGKKAFTMDKQRWKKILLVKFKRNLYHEILPVAERYRRAAAALDVKDDGLGLELWLPEEKGSEYPPFLRMQPSRHNSLTGKIALAPGAHHFTKRWPVEKFAALVSALVARHGSNVILLGGPADKALCESIRTMLPENIRSMVSDRSGAGSVFETARLLDGCALLITNDTGVMHIAAARKVPVLAIFGSTVKEFGFAPFRTPYRIVETQLPCRPCTHIGRSECPLGHFNCMNLIAPDEVLRNAKILAENLHH